MTSAHKSYYVNSYCLCKNKDFMQTMCKYNINGIFGEIYAHYHSWLWNAGMKSCCRTDEDKNYDI